MENITDVEDDAILRPDDRRPEEPLPGTPVAKKTRAAAAARRTVGAVVQPTNPCDTPRRSARKSVRPVKDYDDIIVKNTLRSATKNISKQFNIEEEEEAAAVVESEEQQPLAQKWHANEVGRVSKKRNRNKNRRNKRKVQEEAGTAEAQEEEKENGEIQGERKLSLGEQQPEEEHKQLFVESETKTELESGEEKPEEIALAEVLVEKELGVVEEQPTEVVAVEKDMEPVSTGVLEESKPEEAVPIIVELAVEDLQPMDSVPTPVESEAVDPQPVDVMPPPVEVEAADDALLPADQDIETDLVPIGVTVEDLDELGLCPLDSDMEQEEMPSLIIVDDDNPEENVLNRTFDTETKESDEQQPPQLEDDQDMPSLTTEEDDEDKVIMQRLQMSPDPVRVVLTTDLGQQVNLVGVKSKVYNFPTPCKSNSRDVFQFGAGTPKAAAKSASKVKKQCSRGIRKRSNSMVEGKAKTVSFQTSMEVDLNGTRNVTMRRRRSRSAEAPELASRIPKPTSTLAKPMKAKTRTKLPNFAAIHQNHFDKMENLVDHMSRKAERAKDLIHSNKKLPQNASSVSAKKNTMSVKQLEGSKSSKNLGFVMTPMKPEETDRQRGLPTPRKILLQPVQQTRLPLRPKVPKAAGVAPKPVQKPPTAEAPRLIPLMGVSLPMPLRKPILEASLLKPLPKPILGASLPKPVEKPRVEPQKKFEAKRERHMNMFKNRPAKENRKDIIRGVRSNRRFELQMAHRRHMIEDQEGC